MGAFSVTSSEMTKRTTELRSKNQSLKKQITKLRDSKEALNSTWDGSAKKAFSSAVESDVSQMTNFLEDEFDVEISFMEFRRKATLGMAAEYIEELCEE